MLSTSVAPLRADKNSYTLIHTSATKLSLSYFPLLFFFYNLFLDKLFAQQIYEQIYLIFLNIYIYVCVHMILLLSIASKTFKENLYFSLESYRVHSRRVIQGEGIGSRQKYGGLWVKSDSDRCGYEFFFFFFFLMRTYSPYFYFSNNIFRKKKKKRLYRFFRSELQFEIFASLQE